jgi:hypothetical protein
MATADLMTYEERLEKCFERAYQERLTCVDLGGGQYAVPSRKVMPGDWRYPRLDGANIVCNCEAAQYHNPCTHMATVILARAGELPLRTLPSVKTARARVLDGPRCTKCGQPSLGAVSGGLCSSCSIAFLWPD